MQGARTFSVFACAAGFQLLLVAAIFDTQPPPHFGAARTTLAQKLGIEGLPEVHELFGLEVAPTPQVMVEDRQRNNAFGVVVVY